MDSQSPKQPPKRRRPPRPVTFRESIGQTMPLAPTSTGLTPKGTRILVAGIWIVATLAIGVGIGLAFVRYQAVAPDSVAASPQATVTLTPAPSANLTLPTPSAVPTQPSLTVAPAASVTQAQAGSPFKVYGTTGLQPAATDQLQPGYKQFSSLQGTVDTSPVPSP